VIWLKILLKFGLRGVAQPGSASALGAEGREFESRRPDQIIKTRTTFTGSAVEIKKFLCIFCKAVKYDCFVSVVDDSSSGPCSQIKA
jgi:hypothetical protein